MDWIYYVYTYHPVASLGNNDYQIKGTGGNFNIGRACIADTGFKNIAEIPLKCGDKDKPYLAKYDARHRMLIAVMETGEVCRWKLDDFNREFLKMSFSFWFRAGCHLDDKDPVRSHWFAPFELANHWSVFCNHNIGSVSCDWSIQTMRMNDFEP